jgi:hypothetical protein
MANMEADKAYAVSLLIAGRNVKSPASAPLQTPPPDQDGEEGTQPVTTE